MELSSNISEFLARLQRLKEAMSGAGGSGGGNTVDVSDAMFGAVNAGMGLMKRRIFNNSEDADGKPLGKYQGNKTKLTKDKFTKQRFSIFGVSVRLDEEGEKARKKQKKNAKPSIGESLTEYEKYRLSRGRQIEKKDLELEGSLRRSIECVKSNPNQVVIAITNEEDAKIAKYQEQQIGNIRAKVNANKGKATPARIFVLSQAEYDYTKIEGNRLIKEVILEKFKTI